MNNAVTYLTKLHRLLNEYFNLEEIRTLCFNLDIDYESVPGEEKQSRIRELLLGLGRRKQLPDLISLLQRERPRVNWPPVPDDFRLPESLADVINYYITGAQTYFPQFTAAIESFFTYYLGTEKKPVPFGGRNQELAQLDNWLAQESTQRLLLVSPAGQGKSALLARWSQQFTAVDNLDVVFMPISLRFNTNQEDNTFVILATRLAHFYGKQIPTNYANMSPHFWRGLVADYLREPLPNGRQLLLILDGLDEAAWDVTADILPLDLPTTTQVVASARYLGGEKQTPERWLRRLGWYGLAKVETMELGKLSHDDVREVFQQLNCSLRGQEQADSVVKAVYDLSKGDPLLVQIYFEDLCPRDGKAPRLRPEDLKHKEPGYKGYFDDWWAHQKRLWEARNERPLQEPMVLAIRHLLSMAYGPLSTEDIQNLLPETMSADSAFIQEAAIPYLERFVIGDGRKQGFVFSHPKLADYFRGRLTERDKTMWQGQFLVWGKRTLADLQTGRANPASVPHYLMQYYGRHLENTDADIEDFLELVTWEWMQVWHKKTGTYAGFLQDVDRVWDRLRKLNEKQLEQESIAPLIGQEILCALCHASIISLSDNIPAELFEALVKYDIWTFDQGINYARHISVSGFDNREKWRKVFENLTDLALEKSEPQIALQTTLLQNKFDNKFDQYYDFLANSLHNLVKKYIEREFYDFAIQALKEFPKKHTLLPICITDLLPYIKTKQSFREICLLAETALNSRQRSAVFFSLISFLIENNLLSLAVEMSCATNHYQPILQVLHEFEPHHAEDKVVLIDGIWAYLENNEFSGFQEFAPYLLLNDILPHVDQREQKKIFFFVADRIKDAYRAKQGWRMGAHFLAIAQFTFDLQTLIELAESKLTYPETLVAYYSSLAEEAELDSKHRLWNTIRIHIDRISDKPAKFTLLIDLVSLPCLPGQQLPVYSQDLLDLVRQMEPRQERFNKLIKLADRLPEPFRTEARQDCVELQSQITVSSVVIDSLTHILAHSTELEKEKIFEICEEQIARLPDAHQKHQLYTRLGNVVDDRRQYFFEKAFRQALKIKDPLVQAQALLGWPWIGTGEYSVGFNQKEPEPPENRFFQAALESIEKIDDPQKKARAYLDMARFCTVEQRGAIRAPAINSIEQIENLPIRVSDMMALAQYLPRLARLDMLRESFELALKLEDVLGFWNRNSQLEKLLADISELDLGVAVKLIILTQSDLGKDDELSAFNSDMHRSNVKKALTRATISIASLLSKEELSQLSLAFGEPERQEGEVQLALLARLHEIDKNQALQKTNEFNDRLKIAFVKGLRDRGRFSDAKDVADLIEEPYFRAKALLHLLQPANNQLEQIIEEISFLTPNNVENIVATIPFLEPILQEQELKRLLSSVLQINDRSKQTDFITALLTQWKPGKFSSPPFLYLEDEILIGVAIALADDHIQSALAAIEQIQSPESREEYLVKYLPKLFELDESEKVNRFKEGLEEGIEFDTFEQFNHLFASIQSENNKAKILEELIDPMVISRHFLPFLKEVQSLRDPTLRTYLLLQIIRKIDEWLVLLSEEHEPDTKSITQLLLQNANVSYETLAPNIPDSKNKALARLILSRHDTDMETEVIVSESVDALNKLTDAHSKLNLIMEMLPIISENALENFLNQAISLIGNLEYDIYKFEYASRLLSLSTVDQSISIGDLILDLPDVDWYLGDKRAGLLSKILLHISTLEGIDSALKQLQTRLPTQESDDIYRSFAIGLARRGAETEVFRVVNLIENSYVQASTLHQLIDILGGKNREKAIKFLLEVYRVQEGSIEKADFLVKMAHYYSGHKKAEFFDAAFEALKSIAPITDPFSMQKRLLISLGLHYGKKGSIGRIVAVVGLLARERERVDLLFDLTKELVDQGQYDIAFQLTTTLWSIETKPDKPPNVEGEKDSLLQQMLELGIIFVPRDNRLRDSVDKHLELLQGLSPYFANEDKDKIEQLILRDIQALIAHNEHAGAVIWAMEFDKPSFYWEAIHNIDNPFQRYFLLDKALSAFQQSQIPQIKLEAARALKEAFQEMENEISGFSFGFSLMKLPTIVPFLSETELQKVFIFASNMDGGKLERDHYYMLMGKLQKRLREMSNDSVYRLLSGALTKFSTNRRTNLLRHLTYLTESIVNVGGKKAVVDSIIGVEATNTWWP